MCLAILRTDVLLSEIKKNIFDSYFFRFLPSTDFHFNEMTVFYSVLKKLNTDLYYLIAQSR